ncbi:hypothetical protein AKJ16_DCAP11352 [Drosera capensis]
MSRKQMSSTAKSAGGPLVEVVLPSECKRSGWVSIPASSPSSSSSPIIIHQRLRDRNYPPATTRPSTTTSVFDSSRKSSRIDCPRLFSHYNTGLLDLRLDEILSLKTLDSVIRFFHLPIHFLHSVFGIQIHFQRAKHSGEG